MVSMQVRANYQDRQGAQPRAGAAALHAGARRLALARQDTLAHNMLGVLAGVIAPLGRNGAQI